MKEYTFGHIEQPPKKQPDTPQIETHIAFVTAKKDGRVWIKHETHIIDWKPLAYYEKGVASAQERATAKSTVSYRQ